MHTISYSLNMIIFIIQNKFYENQLTNQYNRMSITCPDESNFQQSRKFQLIFHNFIHIQNIRNILFFPPAPIQEHSYIKISDICVVILFVITFYFVVLDTMCFDLKVLKFCYFFIWKFLVQKRKVWDFALIESD